MHWDYRLFGWSHKVQSLLDRITSNGEPRPAPRIVRGRKFKRGRPFHIIPVSRLDRKTDLIVNVRREDILAVTVRVAVDQITREISNHLNPGDLEFDGPVLGFVIHMTGIKHRCTLEEVVSIPIATEIILGTGVSISVPWGDRWNVVTRNVSIIVGLAQGELKAVRSVAL